jgi:hypothetical protein
MRQYIQGLFPQGLKADPIIMPAPQAIPGGLQIDLRLNELLSGLFKR